MSIATKLREAWPMNSAHGPITSKQRALVNSAADGLDLLTSISWRSADKDNMEFTATITCSQMDRIRELATK